MFLVNDSSVAREDRIKELLAEDPALAALLSVVHFEWTVRRSIIALGTSPNIEVRKKLQYCHGCDQYKEAWRSEVYPYVGKGLPEIVQYWEGVHKVFRLRHRLVHGITSCSTNYAKDRVGWAINATTDIRDLCTSYKVDLDSRLPIRKKARMQSLIES